MDITPLTPKGKQLITAYGAGHFTVSGQDYTSSLLVFADSVLAWNVAAGDSLNTDALKPVLEQAGTIDLLLLGCGRTHAELPFESRQALKSRGINVEVMDTGAAARTYNVLLAEGRRVCAALVAL